MTLAISLGPSDPAGARSTSTPGGLRVMLPFQIGAPAAATATPGITATASIAARTIAIAAALQSPADTLRLVKRIVDAPGEDVPKSDDNGLLQEVIDAYREHLDHPNPSAEISAGTGAAAQSAGVSASLLAQLRKDLSPDQAAAVRRWTIQIVDPVILLRAVKAALRADALDLLAADKASPVLERRVDDLTKRVDGLQNDVKQLVQWRSGMDARS